MPRRPDPDRPSLPGIGGPTSRAVARVRRGVDQSIRALQAAHALHPADPALIAMARTLADAIDAEHTDPDGSRYTVGALSGRLFPVVLELRGERHDAASDIGYDAELATLVAALRDAAQPRPTDDR